MLVLVQKLYNISCIYFVRWSPDCCLQSDVLLEQAMLLDFRKWDGFRAIHFSPGYPSLYSPSMSPGPIPLRHRHTFTLARQGDDCGSPATDSSTLSGALSRELYCSGRGGERERGTA